MTSESVALYSYACMFTLVTRLTPVRASLGRYETILLRSYRRRAARPGLIGRHGEKYGRDQRGSAGGDFDGGGVKPAKLEEYTAPTSQSAVTEQEISLQNHAVEDVHNPIMPFRRASRI